MATVFTRAALLQRASGRLPEAVPCLNRYATSWWLAFLALGLFCVLTVVCKPPLSNKLSEEFVPGVAYSRFRVAEPWSVHVVRVNRDNRDLELRTTHARDEALGLNTLSGLANAIRPSVGVPVVALNGDFFQQQKEFAGDPRGLQVIDGEVISGPSGGVSFWVDASGNFQATNVTSLFKVTWPDGTATPFGLNEDRRSNSWMVLYTPAVGASTKTKRGRELVLERAGESPWLPLQPGCLYHARVREAREGGDSCLSPELMVLSLKPNVTNLLPVVQEGELLTISTETSPNLLGAKMAVSGGPMLVIDGKRQVRKKPSNAEELPNSIRHIWDRHPRSAIGWNDHYLFLVQVDGRQQRFSVGMTLEELGTYMERLGCQQAINLDGGGSSMVWCNGRIMNQPSDKKERLIANALVVVTKDGTRTLEAMAPWRKLAEEMVEMEREATNKMKMTTGQ